MKNSQPHIAVVPSPGMGHLIPLLEFGNRLASLFNFSVSLFIPTSTPHPSAAQTSLLSSLPSTVSHTFLPHVDPSLLPSGVAHEVTIHLIHIHSLPHLRPALSSLSSPVAALFTDLFGTAYFDLARELGIPPYIYFTSNAFCLSFLLHLPLLDRTVSCQYPDMTDPLLLPGCVPLYGNDFVDPCQDRTDESYRVLLYHVNRYSLAEGIFVNTFLDLEPGAIRALQIPDPNRPLIYPVGPITRKGETDGPDCFTWLDRQPAESVLFVSFGSGGTLSKEQLHELAIGLESSGQRFLWVVRSPNDDSSYGSFFSAGSEANLYGFLPEGFPGRVKDRGLLVPSWAPQIKVLAHPSTGGFMTHGGWNSVLESIVNGVPLIAWPLYAEQRMNAVMLNEELKVALRPKANGRGVVEAAEIADVVKGLMEGEEGGRVRQRMKEFCDLGTKAIGGENGGGDSYNTLVKVAQTWRSHPKTS